MTNGQWATARGHLLILAMTDTRITPAALPSFRFGWWMLLLFITLGIVLEGFHGFKVAIYVDVDYQIRRSMWRWAHAWGTLLSVLNVLFAAVWTRYGDQMPSPARLARWLMVASVLIPAGFFGGGLFADELEMGWSAALVPAGVLCLTVSILMIAVGFSRRRAVK